MKLFRFSFILLFLVNISFAQTDSLLKSWNFNTNGDDEGWGILSNSVTNTVSDGKLTVTIEDADPWISTMGVDLSASRFKNVVISLRNCTGDTTFQIYWETGTQGWGPSTFASIKVSADSTIFQKIEIPMSTFSGWNGTIKSLRLDVSDQAAKGYVVIDSIAFIGGTSSNMYNKYIEVLKGYDFAEDGNSQGWGTMKNATADSVYNGKLHINITAGDPWIAVPDIDINTSDIKTIIMKIKNNTPDSKAQFFYETDTHGWAPAYSKFFSVTPNDTTFKEYIFKTDQFPGWDGKLKSLRYDVSDNQSTGKVEIEYFYLCSGQAPYENTAQKIPGKIENEYYDYGGNGIAYFDDSEANMGGEQFRGSESVDIEKNADENSYCVGWTNIGEWVEYTVDVEQDGLYKVDTRYADESYNSQYHLILDDVNLTDYITCPSTGGWGTYKTVTTKNVQLTKGTHRLKVYYDTGCLNLNFLEFTLDTASTNYKLVAEASTEAIPSLGAANTIDGDLGTFWASTGHTGADATEWIRLDQTVEKQIAKVILYPRYSIGNVYCFPVDFSFQTSSDAATWTNVPGQAYTNYAKPDSNSGESFEFAAPVTSRYVRVVATKLGVDDGSGYYFQLGEVKLESEPTPAIKDTTKNIAYGKPVTCSGIEPGTTTKAENVNDGEYATRWASNVVDTAWLYLDLKKEYNINTVKITWEAAYGDKYEIQVSNDAANWTTIKSITDGDGKVDSLTDLNGKGRYVRFQGVHRATQYAYSFYEFEVYGSATTDVNSDNNNVVKTYNLRQNYPNPFNPSTKIVYSLEQAGMVSLKIYNMLGQEVATLVNSMQNSGEHFVSFNASSLTSGVYIYKIQSGSFSAVKKMMFLK